MTAAIPLIYLRIPKIMNELKAVKKDKAAMGYKFRGVDDVYLACQKVLADNGVFTVPEVVEERSEERTSKNGGLLIYRILKIKFKFFAEDGSFIEATVIGEGMDAGDKASNKAMSVAHKYAILQVFMIPTDEPKDPEIDSHEVAPKKIDSRPLSASLNQPKADPYETVWAVAQKNGWKELELSDYIVQTFKKSSFSQLTRDEQIQLYKSVSAYGPTHL